MDQQTKPAPYFAAVLLRLIMAITFIILIAIAVISVIEINGRQQRLNALRMQAEHLQRQIDRGDSADDARQRLMQVESRMDQLQQRILLGDDELKVIMLTGRAPSADRDTPETSAESLARDLLEARRQDENADAEGREEPGWIAGLTVSSVVWFAALSSDQLLALAVIAAAVFGAMAGGLRREDLRYLRPMLAGLAAGFIVYLGIRGLRGVFMSGTEGPVPDFNAFSATLAGLIAGIVAERLYGLLGRRAWKQQHEPKRIEEHHHHHREPEPDRSQNAPMPTTSGYTPRDSSPADSGDNNSGAAR